MPYVSGYQHDVFVSYAHIDNEPLAGDKGWVTTFVGHLKNVLDKGLGSRDTTIWMDRGLRHNEPFAEQIEVALRSSATLIVIASPSYLQSEWCARERSSFLNAVRESAAAGARVFRVDLDKLGPSDFPREFRELLGYPFWAPDTNGYPQTLGSPVVDALRQPEYFTALTKLRIELGEELRRLRSGAGARSPLPTAPAIFLAETTDDQDDQREELDGYARQAGLSVLPGSLYPREDQAEFQRRMEADLRRSKVFVQLLSHVPGKRMPGWTSRLPCLQSEMAKKAGVPLLQWRSRELDLEKLKATSPEHFGLLTGAEVRACGIEEFKRAVVDAARQQTKGPPPPNGSMVFVNSDSSDRSYAADVCRILKEEGFGYSMPLVEENSKPADVREDLELNLSTCDGLILVYGSTPVTWVRRQLAQGRKVLSQRETPLESLALVMCPPEEKQDVGYELPNMRSFDCRNGLRRDVVTAFASSLRGRVK